MATEKGQNRLIFLYVGKIKNLRDELQRTIDRKRKAEELLRDLKWQAKQNARFPLDTDKKVAKYPSGGYAGEVAATVVFAKKKKV